MSAFIGQSISRARPGRRFAFEKLPDVLEAAKELPPQVGLDELLEPEY